VAVYKHEATVPVSESLDRGSGRARPWGPSPLGSARVTSLWVAHRLATSRRSLSVVAVDNRVN